MSGGFNFLLPTYQPRLEIVKAKGSYVWDTEGHSYIDLTSGISVCNLGHCPDSLNSTLEKQSKKLWHTSNIFSHPYQRKLAKKIVKLSFPAKVFFCNSGTEANEGLLKLAKKYFLLNDRKELLYLKKSFHGRTLGSLSVTGQSQYSEEFSPLLPNFKEIEANMESFLGTCNRRTGAIILELIQGEGGVVPLDKDFVKKMFLYCREKEILFLVDEIQSGMGRTGEYFSFQYYGVEPDAFSLSKALGNGFPIGCFFVKDQYADIFKFGSHASTFGGNPLATHIALKVFEELENGDIVKKVKEKAQCFAQRFLYWKKKFPFIKEIRQVGLMIGIEMDIDIKVLIEKCQDSGVLLLSAGEKVLRLLPPLNIFESDIHKALDIVEQNLQDLKI